MTSFSRAKQDADDKPKESTGRPRNEYLEAMKEAELRAQQANQAKMKEKIDGLLQQGKEEEKKEAVEGPAEESETPLNSADNDSGEVTRGRAGREHREPAAGIL